MTRIQSRKRRLWYVLPLALWLLTFLVAVAFAQAGEVQPPAGGEGWFWAKRTSDTAPGVGDPYTYPIPVTGPISGNAFPPEHLYVGWDGALMQPEMISGIAFDMGSIPPGSTITGFTLRMIQHPSGASHNTTPNPDQIHGIIACPWAEFYAGAPGAPMSNAPESERECDKAAQGTKGLPLNPDAVPNEQLIPWTFNLTPMALEWGSGGNAAVSIEPAALTEPAPSWITSFHASSFVDAEGSPQPGVTAQVTWTPGFDSSSSESFGGSFTESFTEGSTDPSFAGSGGLVEDLSPAEAPPPEEAPVVTASRFGENRPAPFWKIPGIAWLGMLMGLAFLAAFGWAVQQELPEARSPGAASALIAATATSSEGGI